METTVVQITQEQTPRWILRAMYWPYLALTALILFHLSINIVWTMRDVAPPWWDQAGYYWGNLRLLREFESGGARKFLAAFLAFQDRSPLFNAVAVPFFAVIGENETAGMMVIWGAFVLLLIVVYRIGVLCGTEEVGVLAAIVTSCMPILYGLSRQFLAEVPLTAVAASLGYMGIRSEGFQKRRSTVLFGMLLGFGLLLKVTFIVYGAAIVAGVIFQRLKEQKMGLLWSRKGVCDIFWGMFPALVIAAPWYVSNFRTVIGMVVDLGYGHTAKLFASSLGWGLGLYYYYLINYGISGYFFSTGCIALVAYLFLRRDRQKRLTGHTEVFPPVILSWFLVSLGVFSLAVKQDIRLLAPVLPAIAILISLWFSCFFAKRRFKWFIGIYSILPLYWVLQFSFSDAVTEWRIGPLAFSARDNHMVYRPVTVDWKNEEVLSELQRFVKDDSRQKNVALVADEQYFEPNWFNFLSLQKRTGFYFFGIPWHRPDFSLNTLIQLVMQCDFVIAKSKDSQRGSLHVDRIFRYNAEIRDLLQNGRFPFAKISDHIALPDGSRVLIYQRAGNLPDPLVHDGG